MNASADIAGMAMTDWPDEQSKSTPYAYGAMYDGLGKRRIEMVTGAQEMTWFRYGLGWKPLSVHEGDASAFWTLGARTISAVSLGHTMLAMTIGTNPADPLGTLDLITDHLGSGRGVLYGTGLVYEAEYTPYGDLYWDNGSPFGIGFTGHLYDADTQLYYAPYRWYSPQTARWTTRDPLGMVDGPNVYGYVGGRSPIAVYDPSGGSARSSTGYITYDDGSCLSYDGLGKDTEPNEAMIAVLKCISRTLGGVCLDVTGGTAPSKGSAHGPNSQHNTGNAADVAPFPSGYPVWCAAKKCGVDFCLDEGNHFHFDLGGNRPDRKHGGNKCACPANCNG